MEQITPENLDDSLKNYYFEIFKNETEKDNPSIINFTIVQIFNAYNKLINTDDQETKNKCLASIKNDYGYLGEKYKDSSEEKEYIKSLVGAIEYLENIHRK